MFKKIMAALGKGGAKIDLVLEQDRFTLNDEVNGELIIFGGSTEQSINKIEVELKCNLLVEENHHEIVVQKIPVQPSFQIQPHEQRSFPFNFVLPDNLLISGNYVSYYFETRLDISGGVDHKDQDPIEITPPPYLQNVLDALSTLGFREKMDSREFDGRYQEFEFHPTGLLAGQAEELEFIAAIQPNGLELLLEIDARTFFGFEKEIKQPIYLDAELLEDQERLVSHLEMVLQSMMNGDDSWTQYSSYQSHSPHFHSSSGSGSSGKALAGAAIGGFAAGVVGGVVGGMVVSELLDDDDDDDDDEEEEMDLSWSSDDDISDFFGDDEED